MEVTRYNPEAGLETVTLPPAQPDQPTPGPVEPVSPDAGNEQLQGSAPAPEPAPEEVPAGQGGFQQRIRTLVTQRNTLREENAMLRAQVAMAQRPQMQPPVAPTQPMQSSPQYQPGQGEPRYDQYGGDSEQYWRDLARYQAEQVYVVASQRERDQRDAEARQALDRDVAARIEEGHTHYGDFDETIAYLDARIPEPLIAGPIKAYLAASPAGHVTLNYLAKHPEALAELLDRNATGVRKYLDALDGQLSRGSGRGQPPARQTPPGPLGGLAAQTQPVRPLNGSGGVAAPASDPAAIANRGGPGSFKAYAESRGYKLR
jgi:hypothetical protein